METKIKLKGLYKVHDGRDCDGYAYWAYLVVTDSQAFITEFTIHSHTVQDFKEVTPKDGEDLFEKLGVVNYEKV